MIEFDKYGHCCVCHKDMLIEQVIDGKVQKRFTPNYAETEYLLSDGSRMRVAVCEQCKARLSEKDDVKIMECVKKGWIVELDNLKHWTEERKAKHLNRYLKLEIICPSENVPQDSLEKKLVEYKEKKDKENGTHS